MDEGSTVTLVDAETAKSIGVEGPCIPLQISCINNVRNSDPGSQRVDLGISGLDSSIVYEISKARTIRNLTLFPQTVREDDIKNIKHLSRLPIECYTNALPLILIGQDNWNLITNIQTRSNKREQPAASLTRLGWVIHGRLSTAGGRRTEKRTFHLGGSEQETLGCISDAELNQLVKFHFTFESIGVTNYKRRNELEDRAEKILASTTTYLDGRWEVGHLWKNDHVKLPDNRENAYMRLKCLERRMDRDSEYGKKYCAQVDHLVASGYAMKLTARHDEKFRSWYLPHFGVVSQNKPEKIRLVFDGAAKTQGVSLNDNLLTGRDLTNSLFGVLIRFRQGKVAIKGNIREMYLQVKIRKEDQYVQKFLWREMERQKEPDTYIMTSMIFGCASSSYTAQYIMRKNAVEYQSVHPIAVDAILRKHYVDDYLDSFDTVEEALGCVEVVSTIQKRGGFKIRNWISNEPALIKRMERSEEERRNVDLLKGEGLIEKTLGLEWNPRKDCLTFGYNSKKIPVEIVRGHRKPTKREMLRVVMSIFDPLKIILPFVIRSKILLQDVWRSGINWDERLKDSDFIHWKSWISSLNQMERYQIPRAYGGGKGLLVSVELHVFTDADDKAYSAVAYLRTCDQENINHVSFVAGKARVAPLKPVSIPRMELQGALLGSRLGDTIIKEIDTKINKRVFWTDSRVVLGWIHANPRKYQSFEAHRLGEIDELTNPEEWRWVPSKENPADCATRDTTAIGTKMNKWLHGPSFLLLDESKWPITMQGDHDREPTMEIKKEFSGMISEEIVYENPDILYFSKWLPLIRSMALTIITAQIWRHQRTNELTAEDLEAAESYLIKKV